MGTLNRYETNSFLTQVCQIPVLQPFSKQDSSREHFCQGLEREFALCSSLQKPQNMLMALHPLPKLLNGFHKSLTLVMVQVLKLKSLILKNK
jgi:hypothetical protein